MAHGRACALRHVVLKANRVARRWAQGSDGRMRTFIDEERAADVGRLFDVILGVVYEEHVGVRPAG